MAGALSGVGADQKLPVDARDRPSCSAAWSALPARDRGHAVGRLVEGQYDSDPGRLGLGYEVRLGEVKSVEISSACTSDGTM
jgi:hypothetical protein